MQAEKAKERQLYLLYKKFGKERCFHESDPAVGGTAASCDERA